MCASKVLFTLLTLVMSRKCTGVSFLRKKNGPGIIKLLYRHIWTQLVPYRCIRLISSVKFISQKETSASTYVRTYVHRTPLLAAYIYVSSWFSVALHDALPFLGTYHHVHFAVRAVRSTSRVSLAILFRQQLR